MEKLTPRKVRKEFKEAYQGYLKVLNDREKKGEKPISFDDYLWNVAENSKQYKRIPVAPDEFDRILKKIGRKSR